MRPATRSSSASDPFEAPAINDLKSLEDRLPDLVRQAGLAAPKLQVGGATALAGDTIDALLGDLTRVALVVVLVDFLLLAFFLRAVIAPLYLLAASVLALAATLGLTAYVFQGLLGYPSITYFVPFATAVLLVALGSDYNVFVTGRIWQEARDQPLREAVATAAPRAARAITVAGLVLAGSFALLALVPLRSFAELGFAMAVGILIDSFIVRSFLVPALVSLFGTFGSWPGRRLRTRRRARSRGRVGPTFLGPPLLRGPGHVPGESTNRHERLEGIENHGLGPPERLGVVAGALVLRANWANRSRAAKLWRGRRPRPRL